MVVPLAVDLAAAPAMHPFTGSDVIQRLIAVFLLIGINAFFVATEFAIVSVRRSRIAQLVQEGDLQAETVQYLQRSIDRLLSTTQLGITLSSLGLGWIGENTIAVVVAEWIQHLPIAANWRTGMAHTISVPLAFLLLAYLQIVLGELYPKSLALLYPEKLARLLSPSSVAISRLFYPFVSVLNESTRLLLRLVGIRANVEGWHHQLTSEELQLIIATATESTGLKAEQRELLNNIFEFGEVWASEVMVPRTSLVTIPMTATLQTLLQEVADSGHTRYPVISDSVDDIRGIVDMKALAEPLATGNLRLDDVIQPWLRPARFVPEQLPLRELLDMMQRSHLPMVIVVDEFGGTAGLITMHDIITAIVGDLNQSTPAEELSIQQEDHNVFLVQAQLDIDTVNDALDIDLPLTDNYDTLGGFLIHHLQKVPRPGEQFQYDNLEFTVMSVSGPRLNQIRIHLLEDNSDGDTAELLGQLPSYYSSCRLPDSAQPPAQQPNTSV